MGAGAPLQTPGCWQVSDPSSGTRWALYLWLGTTSCIWVAFFHSPFLSFRNTPKPMSALSVANCHLHRGERRGWRQIPGKRFYNLQLTPPDWPENTAGEEDLVVQLLRGPTFDHGALLVVHMDMVPHVVRGGNRPNVVDLQPRQAETKLAHCVPPPKKRWNINIREKRNKEESE